MLAPGPYYSTKGKLRVGLSFVLRLGPLFISSTVAGTSLPKPFSPQVLLTLPGGQFYVPVLETSINVWGHY